MSCFILFLKSWEIFQMFKAICIVVYFSDIVSINKNLCIKKFWSNFENWNPYCLECYLSILENSSFLLIVFGALPTVILNCQVVSKLSLITLTIWLKNIFLCLCKAEVYFVRNSNSQWVNIKTTCVFLCII